MQRLTWLVLFPLIIATVFIFNPSGLRHDVGDVKGKYIDIVDSFSEYLVRDKIKNEILGTENKGPLLIIPHGYPNNDYNYYPGKTRLYYSNPALQAYVASLVARGLGLKTERQIDIFLAALRFANALLLALIICVFFRRIIKDYCLNCAPLAPILLSSLAGFVFFSQNLYFISAIFYAPLAYSAIAVGRWKNRALYAGFVALSFLNFSRGYEFATIYTINGVFSALCFMRGSNRRLIQAGIVIFTSICFGFLIAAIDHVLIVCHAIDRSSLRAGAELAFSSLTERTASFDNVPLPLTTQFFEVIRGRMGDTAFVFPWFGEWKLTEGNVFAIASIALLVRFHRLTRLEKLIFVWAPLSYVSWYVFGYQHIMWHFMYEWNIFAATIGIGFCILILQYCSEIAAYARNLRSCIRHTSDAPKRNFTD
ncbi:hypothetical protein [Burkholderia contaminans]|uniref:Glycosyltransferase RgtA/B/C/D-like domain-containing protein n=1 Tax=Burkholderia contaminans TaxID=488447 RepID=A0A6P2ZHB1_9BURK|nr:hypothetical protein [Burkholderia contaminans]VWD30986.1 hypothetical protein BCO71033_03879 [Burkholderia contaminans]